MKCIARVHPEAFHQLFSDPGKRFPGLIDKLIRDFRRYKEEDELPDYFGRDVPYIKPQAAYNAGLMHIHLKIDGFPRNRPQMDRTSDIALVYVQGELEETHFCLLAILDPKAHEKARDPAVMNKLVRMAKAFRDEH